MDGRQGRGWEVGLTGLHLSAPSLVRDGRSQGWWAGSRAGDRAPRSVDTMGKLASSFQGFLRGGQELSIIQRAGEGLSRG